MTDKQGWKLAAPVTDGPHLTDGPDGMLHGEPSGQAMAEWLAYRTPEGWKVGSDEWWAAERAALGQSDD